MLRQPMIHNEYNLMITKNMCRNWDGCGVSSYFKHFSQIKNSLILQYRGELIICNYKSLIFCLMFNLGQTIT